jgi:autonomous glycyl radical cofactor GrcA
MIPTMFSWTSTARAFRQVPIECNSSALRHLKSGVVSDKCVIDFKVFPDDDICRVEEEKRHRMLVDFLEDPEKPLITVSARVQNLTTMFDGYLGNVSPLNRKTLIDAMKNPCKYPGLTIRMRGYSVQFSMLTREQQAEIISRTFPEKINNNILNGVGE